MCTMCVELLPQFYADSFETLQVLLSLSENVPVIFYIIIRCFLSPFPRCKHFLAFNVVNVYIPSVSSVRDYSYSFIPFFGNFACAFVMA